jgi:hypothetical protein
MQAGFCFRMDSGRCAMKIPRSLSSLSVDYVTGWQSDYLVGDAIVPGSGFESARDRPNIVAADTGGDAHANATDIADA